MPPQVVTRYSFDHVQKIAEGLDPLRMLVHKFGSNSAVGASSEDIWTPGGALVWPEAAETVRIKAGGNAADTAAGNGARSVTIEGLDENWDLASETVVTAGASASSPTTITFIRVFRAYVVTVGVYGAANTGAITIENTTSTDDLAQIAAGIGQTEMTHYTIAADKKGYLLGVNITIGGTDLAAVSMYQRPNADDVTVPFTGAKRLVIRNVTQGAGPIAREVFAPIEFASKTDLWLMGVSSGTSEVSADYDLILVNQ